MFKPWRNTDMTIIIEEKDAWGKGYRTEAGHLLLDYAFNQLGFHRVSIEVVGFNKRALRFWESFGFKQEGVERNEYFYDSKHSDCIMMSILEDEFRKSTENLRRSGLARADQLTSNRDSFCQSCQATFQVCGKAAEIYSLSDEQS